MQKFEIGTGQISDRYGVSRLELPPVGKRYGNAQIDDYNGLKRRAYPHRPPMRLSLRARFSHGAGQLQGTAGFGFWNAPLGDPNAPTPTLPTAVWFFYASEPNRLPFLQGQCGWFAATIDTSWRTAMLLTPCVIPVLLGNWIRPIRNVIWPRVERQLGIHVQSVDVPMTEWHRYRIECFRDSSRFLVDNRVILQTSLVPSRPLGFVAWIDNQYMVATERGRFGMGLLATQQEQWLELDDITIT